MIEGVPDYLLIPSVIIAVILILGIAFWARYKTVSPDEAMLVTGSFVITSYSIHYTKLYERCP